MNRILVFTSCIVLGGLVSCASSGPYKPGTPPEKTEFGHAKLNVYPDDVRGNIDAYTNTQVAWVGIVRSTDAQEDDFDPQITAVSIFDSHYFDWVQDKHGRGARYSVSPRGEGLFRTKWRLEKRTNEATAEKAEDYAGRGKLAIVYGVPESVDPDGTIVLKYHYLRILNPGLFTTNEFDYGRLGEPFHVIHGQGNPASATTAPSNP